MVSAVCVLGVCNRSRPQTSWSALWGRLKQTVGFGLGAVFLCGLMSALMYGGLTAGAARLQASAAAPVDMAALWLGNVL